MRKSPEKETGNLLNKLWRRKNAEQTDLMTKHYTLGHLGGTTAVKFPDDTGTSCVCRESGSGVACARVLGRWASCVGWQVAARHDEPVAHRRARSRRRGHACVRPTTASRICCLCTTACSKRQHLRRHACWNEYSLSSLWANSHSALEYLQYIISSKLCTFYFISRRVQYPDISTSVNRHFRKYPRRLSLSSSTVVHGLCWPIGWVASGWVEIFQFLVGLVVLGPL